jgi:hypothetical protein
MLNLFFIYLLLHFIFYVFFLRKITVFGSEKGIFFYHFIPAFLICFSSLFVILADSSFLTLQEVVLIISLHGIYSLSFLEFWSLAQGGYSLSILKEIQRSNALGIKPNFLKLIEIGEKKQKDRFNFLKKINLISIEGDLVIISKRGRILSKVLGRINRWVTIRVAE